MRVHDLRERPGREATIARLDWPALGEAVAGCTACGLCRTRRSTVFGVGPQPAAWMLVGEAPGEQEDLRGEPFVGPAGRLLDQMLAAVGVDRPRDAFIANARRSAGRPATATRRRRRSRAASRSCCGRSNCWNRG